MPATSTLERLHPLPCAAYSVLILCLTIFTRNPVLLCESLVGALLAAGFAGRLRSARSLPLIALCAAVINPVFSHNGATALFFVGDAAITLEAVIYGAVFGVMLWSAALWSVVISRAMTSDKYIYLFGRALPSAGLVLSCSLRFVPMFLRGTTEFAKARGAQGVKGLSAAFASSISFHAEQSMQTADSMRSRGYGTTRRTFYSPYRLTRADIAALVLTAVLGGGSAALALAGAGKFHYYPALSPLPLTPSAAALYASFGALCLLPTLAMVREKALRASALMTVDR